MRLLFLFGALSLFSTAMTMRAESLYEIAVRDIDGQTGTLAPFRGKLLLIVNVASACGFTPQYRGLQALHEAYGKSGLTVLGFPCNQFGEQESGTNAQIKAFCSSTFHVTFPLFEKIDVNGPHRHAIYAALAGEKSPFPRDVGWNFEKFLVSRDGKILQRFDSDVEPQSPELIRALEAALAGK